MLLEYNRSRANKLEKTRILPLIEPFKLNVLWVRALMRKNAIIKTSLKRHCHSFFEAHFIFSGEIIYESNGKEYKVTEGNGIVFAPNTYHLVKKVAYNLEKISVAFLTSQSESVFDTLTEMQTYFFRTDERVKSAFNSLLLEMERETKFSSVLIRHYMTPIICSLVPEKSEKRETPIVELTDLRILSAVKYIEDNKHIFATCSDIAEYCHFNVKYLNRIFKKAMGKTLLEYIHEIKRKDAENLLSETDKTLRQISSELGFENEYYFNTFFKRLNGISPGEYRRLIKK